MEIPSCSFHTSKANLTRGPTCSYHSWQVVIDFLKRPEAIQEPSFTEHGNVPTPRQNPKFPQGHWGKPLTSSFHVAKADLTGVLRALTSRSYTWLTSWNDLKPSRNRALRNMEMFQHPVKIHKFPQEHWGKPLTSSTRKSYGLWPVSPRLDWCPEPTWSHPGTDFYVTCAEAKFLQGCYEFFRVQPFWNDVLMVWWRTYHTIITTPPNAWVTTPLLRRPRMHGWTHTITTPHQNAWVTTPLLLHSRMHAFSWDVIMVW